MIATEPTGKWIEMNCGCCNGLQWGGEYPRECTSCNGSGVYFVHLPSGLEAVYPGGPALGRWSPKEVDKYLQEHPELSDASN